MAQVNVFRGGNIREDMPSNARIQVQDYGENGFATGLKIAGKTVENVAGDLADIQDIHDKAAVKEQINALTQHYSEIGYTGPNAFYSKQGKDAVDTAPMVNKSLDSFIDQSRANFTNDNQRSMFDDAVIPQRQQWGVQIATHADKETKTYASQESASRTAIVGEQAKLSYVQDPEAGEKLIDTGLSEIDARAKVEGWGPEQVAAEKIKFTSGTYRDIGANLASQGDQGPALAQAFVDKHGASMTADDRGHVIDSARVYQNAIDAAQRRAEAEQRREQREEKSDAKDRVDSAMIRVDQGLPLKPEEYAAVLADAKTTGDVNLVRRVEEGQLKNGLSLQYQSATPYQLDARVNELSAQIAKEGANADPKQIIERDHLSAMLNNSRAQLKTDALGWGARHLGLQVGPLILGDPNSVASRLNAVGTVAKRTGVIAAPLMPDEAARAGDILQHGDVKAKVGLALNLAKLGPYSQRAAEQVSNSAAFINLIGLAGHSNRAVAAARVNQIVTGDEVLKTKPKLIDHDQSVQQFNEYMGDALHFLPSVKQGVYSNATAILASDANERGWNEWPEASPRWYAAVNMALGAYTKDGKQYGGLAKFNGQTTVLPENVPQDEFEHRISRSHGAEFRKASNGTPIYADGSSPTATDLKKMVWVPSGDGVYRLSNGNAFLKTKSGDFYEIDFSRLH